LSAPTGEIGGRVPDGLAAFSRRDGRVLPVDRFCPRALLGSRRKIRRQRRTTRLRSRSAMGRCWVARLPACVFLSAPTEKGRGWPGVGRSVRGSRGERGDRCRQ